MAAVLGLRLWACFSNIFGELLRSYNYSMKFILVCCGQLMEAWKQMLTVDNKLDSDYLRHLSDALLEEAASRARAKIELEKLMMRAAGDVDDKRRRLLEEKKKREDKRKKCTLSDLSLFGFLNIR